MIKFTANAHRQNSSSTPTQRVRKTLFARLVRRIRAQSPAQSMVEFALALPILLLLVFGVVEFGRLMQAYLAIENAARFGVRYAITGSFNPSYCAAADVALGFTSDDPNHDCKVDPPSGASDAQKKAAQAKSNALTDWARLPSITDTARAGGMGVSLDMDTGISGQYADYLTHATNTFDQTYRGSPFQRGYFNVASCSNRYDPETHLGFYYDRNDYFYNPHPADKAADYLYPPICEQTNIDTWAVTKFIDDAGGPGDRVRVIITYRHPLITPIISSWWPTLRLTAQREGIVEKFRTARVTGLTGGIGFAATWTGTPTTSMTPTASSTPTETATSTATASPTPTVTPNCASITFDAAPNQLTILDDSLNIGMYNQSPFDVVLTGASGTWLRDWHNDSAEARLPIALKEYGWFAGGYSVFNVITPMNLDTPGMTWSHDFAPNTKTIPIGWSGKMVLKFTRNFRQRSFQSPLSPTDDFNYYHGSDFQVTVRYTVGGAACSTTVTGRPGPTINESVMWSGDHFGVEGVTNDYTKIRNVYFHILDANGSVIQYTAEGAHHYCMFGSDLANCSDTRRQMFVDYWTINGTNTIKIVNGNFLVSLTTIERVTGEKFAARHVFTLTINQSTPTISPTPTVSGTPTRTPTISRTPTITLTPTKTLPPTITRTPTKTIPLTKTLTPTITLTPTLTLPPTKTLTPTITQTPMTPTVTPTRTLTLIPTITKTPTLTSLPTITRTPTLTATIAPTRTPTASPTECQIPPDLGGCP
jgi:hypothetical protein